MRTVVVTGGASGMGAATTKKLRDDGQRVITVDLRDADVIADLGTADGREQAIAEIAAQADGKLDGLVPFAGMAGLPGRPGSLLVSINYFGVVTLLEGLRPLLAAGDQAAAVAISSNSVTCQPGVPVELVEACLAGDEAFARDLCDTKYDSMLAYPSTKTALRALGAGALGAARLDRRRHHARTRSRRGSSTRRSSPRARPTPTSARCSTASRSRSVAPAVRRSSRRSSRTCSGPTRASSAARCSSATAAPTRSSTRTTSPRSGSRSDPWSTPPSSSSTATITSRRSR